MSTGSIAIAEMQDAPSYPIRMEVGDIFFPSGVTVVEAPKRAGKSVWMYSLARTLSDDCTDDVPGAPAGYMVILEPGWVPSLFMSDADRVKAEARENTGDGPFEEFGQLLQRVQRYVFSTVARMHAQAGGGILIIDSLTLLLGSFGKELTKGTDKNSTDDPAMKGGMRRSDIIGLSAFDGWCRSKRVAVIGAINSELFPRTDVLEGACQGSVVLTPQTYAATARLRNYGREPLDARPPLASVQTALARFSPQRLPTRGPASRLTSLTFRF